MDFLLILVLTLLTGGFAMSELALTASRKVRLQAMADEGDRGAQAAQYLADEQALMRSGQVMQKEEPTQYKPSGEMGWSFTTKVPLRDDTGKIVGLMGIGRNITERKQAEEALRQSLDELEKRVTERTAELSQERRLLRTLIDNLPDCIYAKDAAGRKTMANPADLKNLKGGGRFSRGHVSPRIILYSGSID